MAPEIRWGVLRAAVEAKTVPKGCLGLLAYLFAVEPPEIKNEDLAGILDLSEKTIRGQLKNLETAGFITLKRGRHGKALRLLAPSLGVRGAPGAKVSQKDASFSDALDVHKIGKIDRSGDLRSVKCTDLKVEIGKIDRSGNGEIGKIDRPGAGEFLRGMLDALEDGSKQENLNPVCPDNSETKPP